ncbi:MAG: OmpA family protein [Desulfococcaceae bacterium]|jgi:OOP family OmpA-OmpF porin|nr:OmpA family protein [Desulfococcaceae bacterium]
MKNNVLFYVTLFGFIFSCFFSVPAFSEVRPGAFTLSPMGGGYSFDDDRELLDLGKIFTVSLGYNFSRNFASELGFSYIHTDADVCCSDDDVYAYQPRLDFLYHITPENNFVPYLVAGVSYLFFDEDNIAPAEIDDTVQASAGLGVKYFVTDNLALRAEGRYYHGFEDSDNEYAVTAGLVYQIGGERRSEPCADGDNDGVCDETDRCPDTPPGVAVNSAGCTEVEPDTGMQKAGGTGQALEESDTPPPALPEMMSVTVWFDFDRTVIKSEYRSKLEELAAFMQEYPETRASIEGHTDSIGSERYNQKLSEKRAVSVKQYLTEHFGIAPERFILYGMGESQPAASNRTKEGRAQNRRAITVTIMP